MNIQSTPFSTPLLSRAGMAPQLRDKAASGTDATSSFSSVLGGALRSVNASQVQAMNLQRQVELENPSVSLEETMVATQKANIDFQATLNVRNRMVQAYTEIMNMQV
jgi:flagellar hook-basal body complex protein FliE